MQGIKRKFKINVSDNSKSDLPELVKLLERMKLSFNQENTGKRVDTLLKLGKETAARGLMAAQYDGEDDTDLYTERTGTTGMIKARGAAILFIEFGTGVYYEADRHELSNIFLLGARTYPGKIRKRGAWDKTLTWVYKGEPGTNGVPVKRKNGTIQANTYRTRGNPPNRVMYNSSMMIRKKGSKIIREAILNVQNGK
jgi:hypothetical protein